MCDSELVISLAPSIIDIHVLLGLEWIESQTEI